MFIFVVLKNLKEAGLLSGALYFLLIFKLVRVYCIDIDSLKGLHNKKVDVCLLQAFDTKT